MMFDSMSHFFTLTPDYKAIVLQEVHVMVKHGRYSYESVMDMPIWKRRFFIYQMIEEKQAQDEAQAQANAKANK
jgi:hypothetical protein